jgi:hypothetical protein
MKIGKRSGGRKYDFLFRRKVGCNFLRKNLPNFLRPGFAIYLSALQGTIQAHAQSQGMLVLAGKRDEIFITQHAAWGARGAPLVYQTAVTASGSGQSLRTGRKVSQSVRTLSHSWISIP